MGALGAVMTSQTASRRHPRHILFGVLAASLVLACSVSAQDALEGGIGPAQDLSIYEIGPGDQLNINVWGQPELSVALPVRPDGKISTPLVEDVVAVGKSPTELAREMETILAEGGVRTPRVTVMVQSSVGTFSAQIQVLGEVVSPGSVAYRDQMTLLNAVLEAGGLTPFAAGNRAKLTRVVDGDAVELRVRLKRLLEKGDLDENMLVQPGDVVFVPSARL